MSIFLWILQALLAALFAASGLGKAVQAKDELAAKYEWMHDVSQSTVRFIGVAELLGAIGLIGPAATGIAPVLTPVAATGLAVLSALAVALHLRRRETRGVTVAGVLCVLAAFVAWGRFGPYGW
jgi:hypothetical protein